MASQSRGPEVQPEQSLVLEQWVNRWHVWASPDVTTVLSPSSYYMKSTLNTGGIVESKEVAVLSGVTLLPAVLHRGDVGEVGDHKVGVH